MSTIFLIRHGESKANAGLPSTDPGSVGLTLLGHKQARCIAEYLKFYPLDLIITSPYLRAKETAEPTSSMPLFSSVTKEEWNVEEFTYLSSLHQRQSTSEQRRPFVNAYWKQCQPLSVDGIGSKSFAQFIDRVESFIMRLQNTIYDTIAVFSHEQFINAVLWLIKCGAVEVSSQTMQEYSDFHKQNSLLNGTIVQLKVKHNQVSWTYERITGHLRHSEAYLDSRS